MRSLRPKIVGILNVTEDSFSDGGMYLDRAQSLRHADWLVENGPDVLEVGPASSNPDAREVSPEEEIRRLEPIFDRYAGRFPLSVDSFQPETHRWAIERGVEYLNDIHAFPSADQFPLLAKARCKLVVVHSIQHGYKTARTVTDPATILDRVELFLHDRTETLVSAGITPDRIIVDPGMGYFLGSNPEPSMEVLRNLRLLKERVGRPMMVSVSRKSFLRILTGRPVPEVGSATLVAEIYAAQQGVEYIRTHDPRALRDGLTVLNAL